MSLIDMPLEELREYRGLNECPADLDEFWNRSLSEMESLGVDYELEPAAFQAPGAEFVVVLLRRDVAVVVLDLQRKLDGAFPDGAELGGGERRIAFFRPFQKKLMGLFAVAKIVVGARDVVRHNSLIRIERLGI